ncbi:pre-mRNA-splicing factor CWC22 homolog [Oppia nitens]|uniref:pre-mRNA-splicing factor CWC22 homolog n=1 Tax=Oppia nitens TaxID=1686743 RepID=UPI0023DA38AE|nr:pre-mRNA-splicing factor CWC22 homolog [Oppia nitens]
MCFALKSNRKAIEMSVKNMDSIGSTSRLSLKKTNNQEMNEKKKDSTSDVMTANKKSTNSGDSEPSVKRSKQQESMDIMHRTGGAYIPPARLRLMQKDITDKNSIEYQRISWEALKKSINGLINKVNVANIAIIVRELFKENLIRGRGLLCRSVVAAQTASPTFTHVYATLIAICNTKFPKIGELVFKRLIIQFRKSFRRNDKQVCITTTRFIAHLVNQQVAHEVVSLEILTLLLENATNDSVEVAIAFLRECGSKLEELSRRGISAIFDRLRFILHEGQLDKRVQYMIEVMFAIRRDKYVDHPSVIAELDLIEESEQFTHLMTLDEPQDSEDKINVFQFDNNFQDNEEKYKAIKKEILDDETTDDEDDDGEDSDDEDDEDDDEEGDGEATDSNAIIDNTETTLRTLRRDIYLTIQSSLDFEECAHKLLKLELKPGQVVELCHMIVDCAAQQRTYMKFYGLLAQRFCSLNSDYAEPFAEIFKSCYDTIHRFETNKLRNVAKLFAHLLITDAISWVVLSYIKLNEEDTTSSSRVFIKILFQELSESMGLVKLNQRIKDPTLQEAFDGLFPRDDPRNTRFAINFFTSIGLGGLTDDLRDHLKAIPKTVVPITSTEMNSNKRRKSSIESDSDSNGSDDNGSSASTTSNSSSESGSPSSSSSPSSSNTYKLSPKRNHRSSRHSHQNSKKQKSRERHRKDKDNHHKSSKSSSKSSRRHLKQKEKQSKDKDREYKSTKSSKTSRRHHNDR